LDNYIKDRRQRLPEQAWHKECLSIALELCNALTYLASIGLIHRDLKPSNILRVEQKWKLGDIGLVAPIGAASFVGTLLYMPPEGPGKPGGDLYALGVVLYQMLSGDLRAAPPQIRIRRRSDLSIHDRLMQVASKATKRTLRYRFRTAEEMKQTLQEIQKLPEK
jgi:serine/threonine protein kinase